jgi:uncharacterized protein (TIGR03083 family)
MSEAPVDEVVDQPELLRRLAAERARFLALVAQLTPKQRQATNLIDDWSIKDVIAHFIFHEQFALQELQHALRGESYFPKYDTGDAGNAEAVAAQRQASLEEVLAAWAASYAQVVQTVESLTAQDFDPAGPVVQMLGDSIDGALGNNTYGHYAEHLTALQAQLAAGSSR